MKSDYILAICLGVATFAIFIQVLVNHEQDIVNKAIQRYIELSSEKFKQIDEELKKKIDKSE